MLGMPRSIARRSRKTLSKFVRAAPWLRSSCAAPGPEGRQDHRMLEDAFIIAVPSERRAREQAEAVRRHRKMLRKRLEREGY